MNGKDRVRAAVEFLGPDRIPYSLGIDMRRFHRERPELVSRLQKILSAVPQDFVAIQPTAPAGGEPTSLYRAMYEDGTDMWGVRWQTGFAASHPLADNGFDLDAYRFPDPQAAGIFEAADEAFEENPDAYCCGLVWWTMFERYHLLRGMENALIDYMACPDKFKTLQERIFAYDMVILDHWIDLGIDGVFFSDDWGDDYRLLISPAAWREHWRPYYERLFGRARDAGMHVWLHSDGNIFQILPDLVGIGLNVLNPIQPRALDVERLAREYGGTLCFNGGVDVQSTLPFGSPEDVRKEVKYLIETLGGFGGGYIGGVSHSILPDVPIENIVALQEAFEEYGSGAGR